MCPSISTSKRIACLLLGAFLFVLVVFICYFHSTAPNGIFRKKIVKLKPTLTLIEFKNRDGVSRLDFVAHQHIDELYGGGLSNKPQRLDYYRGDILLHTTNLQTAKIDTFSLDDYTCGFADGKSGSGGHGFSDLIYYPSNQLKVLYFNLSQSIVVLTSNGWWMFFSSNGPVVSGRLTEDAFDLSSGTILPLLEDAIGDKQNGVKPSFHEAVAEELTVVKHPTDCKR